jgi:hypothetical protein
MLSHQLHHRHPAGEFQRRTGDSAISPPEFRAEKDRRRQHQQKNKDSRPDVLHATRSSFRPFVPHA